MKHFELNTDEQAVLEEFEAGIYVDAESLVDRKEALEKYAKNSLNKTRNINIRLSERDLYRLKAKA